MTNTAQTSPVLPLPVRKANQLLQAVAGEAIECLKAAGDIGAGWTLQAAYWPAGRSAGFELHTATGDTFRQACEELLRETDPNR